MEEQECRSRFSAAPRGVLATCGVDRRPHLVPVTFAVAGDVVVTAVDHKPKTTTRLRRLRNIAENPSVAFLLDHYEQDWEHLWWWRVERYPQYRAQPPAGPVIRAEVTRWSGWSAS